MINFLHSKAASNYSRDIPCIQLYNKVCFADKYSFFGLQYSNLLLHVSSYSSLISSKVALSFLPPSFFQCTLSRAASLSLYMHIYLPPSHEAAGRKIISYRTRQTSLGWFVKHAQQTTKTEEERNYESNSSVPLGKIRLRSTPFRRFTLHAKRKFLLCTTTTDLAGKVENLYFKKACLIHRTTQILMKVLFSLRLCCSGKINI